MKEGEFNGVRLETSILFWVFCTILRQKKGQKGNERVECGLRLWLEPDLIGTSEGNHNLSNHNLRCEIGEQELDNIWQGKAVAQAQIYEDIKNLGREM